MVDTAQSSGAACQGSVFASILHFAFCSESTFGEQPSQTICESGGLLSLGNRGYAPPDRAMTVWRIIFPNIRLTSARGMTAVMIRFMRPAMCVARLALSAASPSAAHSAGDIILSGSLHRSKPKSEMTGVSVGPGRRTVT